MVPVSQRVIFPGARIGEDPWEPQGSLKRPVWANRSPFGACRQTFAGEGDHLAHPGEKLVC